MDSILNNDEDFEPMLVLDEDDDYYIVEKSSMWVIEGNVIRPSTTLNIQKKLNPGVYKVDYDRSLGLFCKKINFSSDELYELNSEIIERLFLEISAFWEKRTLYKENNLLHKRGILLEGPPGSGKTSIITQLSQQIIAMNGLMFLISGVHNLNTYVDFIVNNFRSIEPSTPIITVIEEIERYNNSEIILDFLDGKTNIEHHIVLCTSNNTTAIPDTFLRPSRIDLRIEISTPNIETIKEYFIRKKVPDEFLGVLIEKAKGLSMADLKELYTSVFLLDIPIEEAVQRIKEPKKKINYMDRPSKRKLGL